MCKLTWRVMTCRDLREMLREKLAILEGRKEITGASTGGGTSYTAQETMSLKDHIACLQEAITIKKMEEGDFSGLAAADDGGAGSAV